MLHALWFTRSNYSPGTTKNLCSGFRPGLDRGTERDGFTQSGASTLFFKEFRPPVRFLRRKSVAVAAERAGTRVPEFTDILRGIAKLAEASKNGFDSGDYERIIVVVRLDPPEKDVAIEEVRRPCHLAGHLIKAQLVFKIDSIVKSRRLKQLRLLSCSISNSPMSQTCCAESFVSSRWNDCCAFSLRSITT
jgi:hypothetical protein